MLSEQITTNLTVDIVESDVMVIPDIEARVHLTISIDDEYGPAFSIDKIELEDQNHPGVWVLAKDLGQLLAQAIRQQSSEQIEQQIATVFGIHNQVQSPKTRRSLLCGQAHQFAKRYQCNPLVD